MFYDAKIRRCLAMFLFTGPFNQCKPKFGIRITVTFTEWIYTEHCYACSVYVGAGHINVKMHKLVEGTVKMLKLFSFICSNYNWYPTL